MTTSLSKGPKSGSYAWTTRAKLLVSRISRSRALRHFGEIGEWIGKISGFFGIVTYLAEGSDRAKQRHYQAWQALNIAQSSGSDNRRADALLDLAADDVNLRGLQMMGCLCTMPTFAA